jgi:ParB-like chromosome segregation protein Spo0J
LERALVAKGQPITELNNMTTTGDSEPRTVAAPAVACGMPVLKSIPLHLITAVRNPRHTAHTAPTVTSSSDSTPGRVDVDLEGLARSLGPEDESRLVEPPVVEEMPDGSYRLCAGERRADAARLAGWSSILCLVYPPMDPARAHTLGLVENMHRLPMHPLEEISALCISRLLANADARGIGEEARRLLGDGWEQGSSSYSIIQGLERILRDSGWVPERPDVTWKVHLDDLGISMAPWERKRKLRMLNIDPSLQEQLREVDITEAALRSLGTLEPEDQKRVVEALSVNPSLARKVRRVARARRDGFYDTIDDALAEVQGLPRLSVSASLPASSLDVPTAATEHTEQTSRPVQLLSQQDPNLPGVSVSTSIQAKESAPQDLQTPMEVQDAVLQLLECADRLSAAMSSLEAYSGGATLPEPWGTWSRDALNFIDGLLERGHTEMRPD